MKAVIALSLLLLFAQNSLQDDSPAQKACKALHEKYPKLTAYGLDHAYIEANTGTFPFYVVGGKHIYIYKKKKKK